MTLLTPGLFHSLTCWFDPCGHWDCILKFKSGREMGLYIHTHLPPCHLHGIPCDFICLQIEGESETCSHTVVSLPSQETGNLGLKTETPFVKQLPLLSSRWVLSDSFPTPWSIAHQAPPSMRFPRQEYWNELQFPSPGDLPNSGIEPTSPAMAGRFFTTEPPVNPKATILQ